MGDRLFVVGGTGGTGRHVVRIALDRGLPVTAFVRSPDRLGLAHERLRAVVGDPTDRAALAAALPGHAAVVCTLGQQRGTPPDFLRRAADALVLAMGDAGVARLVALGGSGAKFPGDAPPPLFERISVRLVRLVLPHLVDDTRGYAARIAASDLAWTLARPMRLTDGPGGATLRVAATMTYGARDHVDRADVARFLLDQLAATAWVRRAPMVTAAR